MGCMRKKKKKRWNSVFQLNNLIFFFFFFELLLCLGWCVLAIFSKTFSCCFLLRSVSWNSSEPTLHTFFLSFLSSEENLLQTRHQAPNLKFRTSSCGNEASVGLLNMSHSIIFSDPRNTGFWTQSSKADVCVLSCPVESWLFVWAWIVAH